MSTISLLIFIALNLSLLASGIILTLLINSFQKLSISKLILEVFVLFVSQIIIIEIALGIFGKISYLNVSIIAYLIFATLAIKFGKRSIKALKKTEAPPLPPTKTTIFFFLPVATLLFLRAFNALLQIPLEHDSVAYHLPYIVEWLKSGSLMDLYYTAFASPISYYPSNYELLGLFSVLPFNNDIFLNLINFLIYPIFAISIYKILTSLKASPHIAIISTSLLFYMPVFLRQAGLPLVDLFFSTLFAISIFLLIEIWKKSKTQKADLIIFGLTVGLFIGTKYLGLVYGAIPIVLLIATIRKPKLITLAAIPALITGSFFYIRNWIDSGNPIFPVDISLLGTKIFEGYIGMGEKISTTSLLANIKDMGTLKEFYDHFTFMVGYQGLIAAASIALTLGLLIYKVFKKKSISKELLLALGSTVYFFLYFKSPYSYRDLVPNVRYAMMFLIIIVLNFGYIISQFKSKWILRITYLISVVALTISFFKFIIYPPNKLLNNDILLIDTFITKQYLYWAIMFALSLLGFGYATKTALQKRKSKTIIALFFSSALMIALIQFSNIAREGLGEYFYTNWYEKDEQLFNLMEGANWLNQNANTAKIAYTGFNFHYHLYGRGLQREADYVNINECKECRYVDYKNSENSIRRDPNYENWIKNLEGKEYLMIEPEITTGVTSFEFTWANKHPEKFEEVFNQGNTYIYKIHD